MKNIAAFAFAAVIFLAATSIVFAGAGNRIGTGGAAQLLIPVGARDLAMGGSTIATTTGIDALFWNPAGTAMAKNSANLMFSHMSYIADIGVEYGAVTANFEGLGTIGLSVKSLSIGEIPVTTTQDPDGTGEMYSPQFFTAGLLYSRMLSDRISVGVLASLITERISEVSATGVAFNVGVMYKNLADIQGLSLGVAVKNIGPQMKYDGAGLYALGSVATQNRPPQYYKAEAAPFELPSMVEIGVGYKKSIDETNNILVSGSFQNNNFSEDEYKVGAEYSFNNNFFVRGGWVWAPTTPDNSNFIYGPTVGAGIQYNLGDIDLALDYAFRHTDYFSGNHTIAVSLGF